MLSKAKKCTTLKIYQNFINNDVFSTNTGCQESAKNNICLHSVAERNNINLVKQHKNQASSGNCLMVHLAIGSFVIGIGT